MPFHFTSDYDDISIYMGIDRDENELMLKYGCNRDLVFHVDKLSSAHLYLRTSNDIDDKLFKKIEYESDFEKYLDIPQHIIEQCLQLTKLNSSQAKKLDRVYIFVTPWYNIMQKNYIMSALPNGTFMTRKNNLIKRLYPMIGI